MVGNLSLYLSLWTIKLFCVQRENFSFIPGCRDKKTYQVKSLSSEMSAIIVHLRSLKFGLTQWHILVKSYSGVTSLIIRHLKSMVLGITGWHILTVSHSENNIFFLIFSFFLQPCNFLYGISTLKGFPRQKAILTTYMHYILPKKHDLNDFEKNRKCPHGNAVWDVGWGTKAPQTK